MVLPEKPEDPPSQHDHCDQDAGKLKYGDFVAALRHAAQTAGAAFDGGREGREDFILLFEGMDQLLHKLYVNRLEDRMGGKGKGLFVQSFFFPAREKGREFLRE